MTYAQLSALRCGDKVKDTTSGYIGTVVALVCGESLDDSEVHADSDEGEMSMFADELEVINGEVSTV